MFISLECSGSFRVLAAGDKSGTAFEALLTTVSGFRSSDKSPLSVSLAGNVCAYFAVSNARYFGCPCTIPRWGSC